jgi:hypothetical protein
MSNVAVATGGGKRKGGNNINNEIANAAVDTNTGYEFIFCSLSFPDDPRILLEANIFIADSAASVDMTGHKEGMYRLQSISTVFQGTGGKPAQATAVGDIETMHCDNKGREIMPVSLHRVHYTPDIPWNLISITKRMKSGWRMEGDYENGIILRKDGVENIFNIKISTSEGYILGACFHRQQRQEAGMLLHDSANGKTMTVETAHNKLGHMSDDATRSTARHLGWRVQRAVMPPCESCTIGKARQANVCKQSKAAPARWTRAVHILIVVL